MRGKFVVMIGMDGSGKSTVLQSLIERGLKVADWKDLREYEEISYSAPEEPHTIRNRLKPLSRSLFVASHIVAEYEYLIEPIINKGISIVLDSYYYRSLAKEAIYGKNDPIFHTICTSLPQPDYIIDLKVDPEIAFERKVKARAGTLGVSEFYHEPTLSDFINFQKRVRDLISIYTNRIPIMEIDSSQKREEVLREVMSCLEGIGFSESLIATKS